MKKWLSLLLLLLLGFSGSLLAAFLENVPQRLTQPNGIVVSCFASGDEYYHWLHDANGFTIIQNRSTGYFVYADRNDDDLIPTSLLPGVDNPGAAGLIPRLNISSEKYREYFTSRFKAPAVKSGYTYTNTGNYNNLVIFIRFSNQDEYAEPLTRYSTAFNGSGTVSMTEYFKEVSKSQLAINTTFYPNPDGSAIVSYQDAHSRKYYQPYSTSNTEGYRTDAQSVDREMTLLKNAVEYVGNQVIASGIDYDHDHDNRIDNVCFVVQGATDGWSDLLWPHRWVLYQYDVRIGDDRVYDFNFQLSDALGVSVLCHEMFHSLGAPDLYRYENDDITPVGPWDLMAHNKTPPQHMSAYMKMKYGKWFSQIPTITTDGTYTLKPLATDGFAAYKIPSPNSTSEFFVVEYRKATGRFESSLVGSGLIISRVNTSLEGNAEGPPDEIYVYRQNGTNRNDGNINNATFSSSVGRAEFGDNTGPSDFLSSGAAGGIHIYNIGAAGETISFTVGTGGALNPPQELMATLSGRDVSLSWKKPLSGSGTLAGYKVYRNTVLVSAISNVNTLSYTESNLPDGTYEYYVTARYTSPTGESSGSNEITVVVSPEPKPDLIMTNPSVLPVNVEPGGIISLSCTLVNSGPAQAGNSVLRVYLSQDNVFDSGDRQLASWAVNPVDAGAESEILKENIRVSSTTEVGKWHVIFLADADGNVAESIENNNQASALIMVGNPSLNPPRNLVAQ
ncbi:MAG: M6 family metalloprotease domain-containing protein, partial [Bacteroidales bacterium]|nr:M6 family metalloprotease domain-containing protein [Bacteroidales bacterium]